jgi:hypothetical protein
MDSALSPSQSRSFKGLWFKSAYVFQILTALVHSLSFINKPTAANDTEQQMLDLMMTYKNEMGAGFTPTMFNILTSLSAGFALLYLLGGLLNWYLWQSLNDRGALRGAVMIQWIVYGVMFVVCAFFTFLPPVIMTGLVFLLLLIAWLTWPKKV